MFVSDGGPQFSSYEFKQFAKAWDFRHEPADPYFPRGNYKVERSVQTVKNLIKHMQATQMNMRPFLLTEQLHSNVESHLQNFSSTGK